MIWMKLLYKCYNFVWLACTLFVAYVIAGAKNSSSTRISVHFQIPRDFSSKRLYSETIFVPSLTSVWKTFQIFLSAKMMGNSAKLDYDAENSSVSRNSVISSWTVCEISVTGFGKYFQVKLENFWRTRNFKKKRNRKISNDLAKFCSVLRKINREFHSRY